MENTAFLVSYALLWLVVLLLGLMTLKLSDELRRLGVRGAIRELRNGPKPGAKAPALQGTLLGESGSALDSDKIGARVVVFARVQCDPCWSHRRTIADLAGKHGNGVNLLLSCEGSKSNVEEFASPLKAFNSIQVIADTEGANMRNWKIDMTPFAVLVGSDGRVRSKSRLDRGNLEAMLRQVSRREASREIPNRGWSMDEMQAGL